MTVSGAIAETKKGSRAPSETKRRQQSYENLLRLVEESGQNRIRIAEMLTPHTDAFIRSLIDLARGVLLEPHNEKNASEDINGIRIYRRAPDPQAVRTVIQLSNIDPSQTTAALMAYVRAMQSLAEIEAEIAVQKARNLASQTTFNEKQTEVFSMSLVSEDEQSDAMMSLFYEFMGVIDSESREALLAASESDEAYSLRKKHIGSRAKKKLAEVLSKHGVVIEQEEEAEDTGDYTPSEEGEE